MASGGSSPPPPTPLFWVKQEEIREGRKAGRASKTKPGPLLTGSMSGSATAGSASTTATATKTFHSYQRKIIFKCYVKAKMRSCEHLRGITRVPHCRYFSFFQIFKASSPKFMEVILLGAMCMYSTVRCYLKNRCLISYWFCHFSYNFTVFIISL